MTSEVKHLTTEDVARIVEQVPDKREPEARKRGHDSQFDDVEIARMEKHAELVGESIGKAVEAAIERCVEKCSAKERNRRQEKEIWGW
jgi:hypothetical protein